MALNQSLQVSMEANQTHLTQGDEAAMMHTPVCGLRLAMNHALICMRFNTQTLYQLRQAPNMTALGVRCHPDTLRNVLPMASNKLLQLSRMNE
jgi:hypothetical protein